MIGCPEAEAALLGGCLLAPSQAPAVLRGLTEGDFIDPRHQVVLAAMLELIGRDVPPDPVTVLGQLRRTGQLRPFTADRDPGVFLVDLAAATPLPASARYYRAIVLEHSLRRRAHQAGERLQQAAEAEDCAVLLDVLEREQRAMQDAARRLRAPLAAVEQGTGAA